MTNDELAAKRSTNSSSKRPRIGSQTRHIPARNQARTETPRSEEKKTAIISEEITAIKKKYRIT